MRLDYVKSGRIFLFVFDFTPLILLKSHRQNEEMSLRVDTLTLAILLIGNLQLISVIGLNNTKILSMTNFALLHTTTNFNSYKNKKRL